jgi:arginyl-tRNA--protein-N-Asp/Glu arginylyltransferase
LGEDIGRDLNDCQWRFKFVGKIIYEILLYFCQEFLAIKIKQTESESNQRKEKCYTANDPEIHFAEDILGTVREVEQYMIIILRVDR